MLAFRSFLPSLVLLGFAVSSSIALAQGGGGALGGGGGGALGGGGGGAGGNATGTAGISVDATGVLKRMSRDPSGRLTAERLRAAKRDLGVMAAKTSPMRLVSLNRLEQALADQLAKNNGVPHEMLLLGGLTRLEYVFYLPDSNDIVIGGPAEAYFEDAEGEIRGTRSGRPILQLQDLVVALRAFPPRGNPTRQIGCSIDPTQEGLARFNQYVRSLGGRATPRDTRRIATGLKKSLGMQEVTVLGVSPKTRFASILVSADYRMKLIGIGLERPAVRFKSYVENARSQEGLVRWWFTPNYETVRVSEDGLAMQLVGDGVKLVGEDELVSADGSRRATGKTSGASRKFVEAFTRHYSAMAVKEPVYAHLRNLIDMTVAAAYIQQEDFYSQAGWELGIFGDESQFQVETHNAPSRVETAVNAVWKGNRLMTPIGGGVDIQPALALAPSNRLADEQGRLKKAAAWVVDKLAAAKSDGKRWYWDAMPIK